MRRLLQSAPLIAALAGPAGSAIYLVTPEGTGDFPTIQAAVDAVVDGDVIELTNGVFTGDGNRDVDFLGKAITLRSQSGDPDSCIIDCEQEPGRRGFLFHSGESSESRLESLTIANGSVELPARGGGVLCEGSSPTISACVFTGNVASGLGGLVYGGGGICCDQASPYLLTCDFRGNSADDHGGGVFCWESSPTLIGCTFTSNTAAFGGGLAYDWNSAPAMIGCTFFANAAAYGSGLACSYASQITVENTILSFGEGEAVYCPEARSAILTCCNIYGNLGGDWTGGIAGQYGMNGNISADPLFCDPENDNLHLREDSPCAPFSPPNPECDLIGARPVGCDPAAISVGAGECATVRLGRCVPSPFMNTSCVTYTVSGLLSQPIVLAVHDVAGRLVRTLVSGARPPGMHAVRWDGADQRGRQVKNGVYVYRLTSGRAINAQQVIKIR